MAKCKKGPGVAEYAPVPDGYREIFSPVIRLRNGRVIHAAAYGLRAFRFFVKN